MNTKKLLLSLFIIISSVIYVLFQQVGNGQRSFSSVSSPTTSGPTSNITSVNYKDGEYSGSVADAYYGNIQVKAIIKNGKITDIQFLDYPQDRRTSISINTSAMPILKSEAIAAQSAKVDIVTGATDTSRAFQESLTSALNQATNQA